LSGARKRFWERAHVVGEAGAFAVHLDDRPVRLAGGAPLLVAARPLAEALALEWAIAGGGKGGLFGPDDLVLTALAGTLQERVAPEPERSAQMLMAFANSDLLCYRATQPDSLVSRQANEWQPWLDWLHAAHGVRMTVTAGLMPVSQPEPVLAGLGRVLGGVSPAALTGLGVIVPALGSLVLGLALAERRLDAATAFRLARLDEDFQASRWGADPEDEARAARLHADVAIAARFMELADG
jgi:chaperone required for assembly of F1-ATPase